MTYTTEDGEPKIVETLACLLAAKTCVTKNFTGLAVVGVMPDGYVQEEEISDFTAEEV